MSRPDDLARDYRAAFLRYLPRQAEAAAHSGYELGRSAVADGVSILELVRVHLLSRKPRWAMSKVASTSRKNSDAAVATRVTSSPGVSRSTSRNTS